MATLWGSNSSTYKYSNRKFVVLIFTKQRSVQGSIRKSKFHVCNYELRMAERWQNMRRATSRVTAITDNK